MRVLLQIVCVCHILIPVSLYKLYIYNVYKFITKPSHWDTHNSTIIVDTKIELTAIGIMKRTHMPFYKNTLNVNVVKFSSMKEVFRKCSFERYYCQRWFCWAGLRSLQHCMLLWTRCFLTHGLEVSLHKRVGAQSKIQ